MELYELEKRFGTERQCREYIAALRWPDGYRCPRCQHNKAWKTKEYKYKCQNCGYKSSVTAGTIFQDSHVPLPLWFKAIWLISSKPMDITASTLKSELRLGSNRTALTVLHTLKQAMIYPALDKLQGHVELATTYIRLHNQNHFAIIAVEVLNRKIGRIRIRTIRREFPTDLTNFIHDCIEAGSTLLYRDMSLQQESIVQNYSLVRKAHNYSFSFSERVINKLRSWLHDSYTNKEIPACLDEFCMRVNSLKTKIPFEVFVQNAVNLKLSANDDNIYGIKL